MGSRRRAYRWGADGDRGRDGDTAHRYRAPILRPFFDQYLKPGSPKADVPAAFVYDTGLNRWDRFSQWPLACQTGCAAPMRPLYLQSGHGLSFKPPAAVGPGAGAFTDSARWKPWLTTDQRSVADRAT